MSFFKEFQYQERAGIYRTAWLTNAHWPTGILQGTEDPKWELQRREDNSVAKELEWLEYWGTDGRIWKVKVHAEYDGVKHSIEIWLEHKAEDGTTHGDSREFAIRDWDGKFRGLEISSGIANDTAPTFRWK
ncbi:hypothetical protein [Taibaiella soli]|uniref:Uncharacterized protein n=1 Tax=Taibaiella soli TaxID=1649169 RepID=A0A2W2BW79_9BACT|nr:hypothetical protein [Taibaiella soli]PZF72103.1 hypothetical protein DN068_14300 [Taibaiella soli]